MENKKDGKVRRKRVMHWSKWIVIIGIIIMTFTLLKQAYDDTRPASADINYIEFKQLLDDNKIVKADITTASDTFRIETADGNKYEVINPRYEDFKKDLLESGVEITVRKESFGDSVASIVLSLPMLIFVFVFCMVLYKQMGSITRTTFNMLKNNEVITFDDVAGLGDIKKDVQFAIDTLTDYRELASMGGRPTKGIILEGPPGTGKTLIAKAIAGEAKVPFISTSGSDFIEMFVGLGAARVRSLWQLAKENAPCVIFIDEIDAVGRRRQQANSGAMMESNQTLNALLQKMDGLEDGSGILVIAATNMIDDLDPALLRPGRFDKKIYVGPPKSKEARDEIIKIHVRNKKFDNDTTIDNISKLMFGLTGAEIESTLNEAVMISIQNKRKGVINYKDVDEAVMRLRVSGVIVNNYTEKDRYVAAIHEAGHAIMNIILGRGVSKVSITAYSSGVGGVTVTDVDSEINQFKFESDFKNDIKILLAGMIAERIVFKENSLGCSNDLERATELCKSMIFKWGMRDNQLVNIDKLNNYNVTTDYEIKLVNEQLNELSIEAMNMLRSRKEQIKGLADRLMEEETIIDLDSEVYKV